MRPSVPPSLFSIPFGLAGLTTAWVYAGRRDLVPGAIGDWLAALGGLVWLVVLAAYGRSIARQGLMALVRDFVNPVTGPFTALIPISALLLVLDGVVPHAPDLGRVVVDVLIVVIVLHAGWSTGQWMHGTLEITDLHPGYFLPSVAGGLLAAIGAAAVGQMLLAEVLFGLGVISWLLLGSMILARLFFGAPLPPALMPTRTIQVAPAAVASLAYLALYGDRIDAVVAGLAGYGLLMVIAQIRLIPAFLELDFGLPSWSFTFSLAAVASVGLHWLAIEQPGGWKVYSLIVLAAITGLVGVIAVRTVIAAASRSLLPATPRPVPVHA